jgi:hypothetical protein
MRQFNPSRLKLMCKAFFGQYKLDMKISHQVPYLTEGDNTPRGSKIFSLDFTADKIEFYGLDASQYNMKVDSYPYAILRVDYLQVLGERKLCKFFNMAVIHPFYFRIHSHKFGRV